MTHEVGRAANVCEASPLAGLVCMLLLANRHCEEVHLLNFPQMVNSFICCLALTSLSPEYKQKGEKLIPLYLPSSYFVTLTPVLYMCPRSRLA